MNTTAVGLRTGDTLAGLRKVQPDLQEVEVEQGLDKAMAGYRRFLEDTPETAMTPEAISALKIAIWSRGDRQAVAQEA